MSLHYSHYKAEVIKPCLESWSDMTPVEGGRFCGLCQKNVTDFTQMTDGEVQQFLIKQAGQSFCGRFRHAQLERIRIELPVYFFQKKIPAWQKYLAIFLFCFGSNLYGVDVSFGKQQGLSAQTIAISNDAQSAVSKTHKHKKVRKKKKTQRVYLKNIEEFIPGMTLGFAIIRPETIQEMIEKKKAASQSLWCGMPAGKEAPLPENDSIVKPAGASPAHNRQTPEVPDTPKKPWQKTAFIIPQAWRWRPGKKRNQ